MAKYSKAFVALAGFAGVFAAVAADGNISASDAGALVVAALAAVGVYQAKNAPPDAPPA